MAHVRCGKPALFDMDTSLFDFEEAIVRDLKKLCSPEEFQTLDLDNVWGLDEIPHMKARCDLIKGQPGWWARLKPIAAGFRVWNKAKEIGFDMAVATKGPWTHPLAWAEKLQSCQTHLGDDIDVHITTNKGAIYGYFLYDDYTDYMESWLRHRPRGWGIMPVTASNKDFTHPRVIKYQDNFDEVAAKLEELFKREAGSK